MAINSEPDIHKLVICANVYLRRGEKLLMLRRSLEKKFLPGYIQPIGGKVDLDEDPLTAAKRELLEESNLTAKKLQLRAVVTEIKTRKDTLYQNNWQIFHFVAEYDEGTPINTEEGELVWLTLDQIKKEKIAESVRLIIDDLFNNERGIVFAKYIYGEENSISSKEIACA